MKDELIYTAINESFFGDVDDEEIMKDIESQGKFGEEIPDDDDKEKFEYYFEVEWCPRNEASALNWRWNSGEEMKHLHILNAWKICKLAFDNFNLILNFVPWKPIISELNNYFPEKMLDDNEINNDFNVQEEYNKSGKSYCFDGGTPQIKFRFYFKKRYAVKCTMDEFIQETRELSNNIYNSLMRKQYAHLSLKLCINDKPQGKLLTGNSCANMSLSHYDSYEWANVYNRLFTAKAPEWKPNQSPREQTDKQLIQRYAELFTTKFISTIKETVRNGIKYAKQKYNVKLYLMGCTPPVITGKKEVDFNQTLYLTFDFKLTDGRDSIWADELEEIVLESILNRFSVEQLGLCRFVIGLRPDGVKLQMNPAKKKYLENKLHYFENTRYRAEAENYDYTVNGNGTYKVIPKHTEKIRKITYKMVNKYNSIYMLFLDKKGMLFRNPYNINWHSEKDIFKYLTEILPKIYKYDMYDRDLDI